MCYAGIMPQFTRETAREAQRKSAESRRANRMAGGQEKPQAAPQNPPADEFVSVRLARVRTQLNGIADKIDVVVKRDEFDAKQLDQLASAFSRLSEIERQLAGRPLPGSLRPAAEKPRRGAGSRVFGDL